MLNFNVLSTNIFFLIPKGERIIFIMKNVNQNNSNKKKQYTYYEEKAHPKILLNESPYQYRGQNNCRKTDEVNVGKT